MTNTIAFIKNVALESKSRFEFWMRFINHFQFEQVLEIGVYRGDFATQMLKNNSSIKQYYMIDPWKHLEDWNKPANKNNELFNKFYQETIERTNFAKEKRIILRGKTREVIDKIPDHSLDFAYIDGDHTLKGITIDLLKVFSKVKNGGWVGGDDFSPSIWQHFPRYEPTLIFPFAVYFAEATSSKIFAIPNNQFLINKSEKSSFDFINFTNQYDDLFLKNQLTVFNRIKHYFLPYYFYIKKMFKKQI